MLGITPAAVGQRIKLLEDYLGVDLLNRGRSGLSPAAALDNALPHLQRAFLELNAAAEALDFQRINEIQIAAPVDWATLWLAPRLPRFRTQHPNILFCINGEGDARLRVGQMDVKVSFGPELPLADDTRLTLFRDFLIPVGSPENASRIARAGDSNRLEGFPLLHLDAYRDDPTALHWQAWIDRHGHRTSPAGFGVRFNRVVPALEATLSDAGLMICGLALILNRVEAGELVLPFPVSTGTWTSHAFHADFRREALVRPQIRRFRDWLETEARTTQASLQAVAGPERP